MRRALRVAVAVLAMGAFAPACSHEIESPAISASGLTPDLACNAKPVSQPFSSIEISGSNMTPMPSKTLRDKRELIMPKVQLTMVTPLAGAAQLPAPLTIADDPANQAASRVKWTSESEMAFEIHEEDKLPTGVMSIKVTNPDGKKETTIAGNLAIVPKPTISEVKPGAICDDQADQTVVINGSNFLFYTDAQGAAKAPTVKVGDKTYTATLDGMCAPVTGSFRETNIQLCSSVSIKILKGDFVVTMPTKVAVQLTNPAPADCQSTETIELTINPPPKVAAVVPATICEGGSTITVNGEGFVTGAKVIIDCKGKRVESSSTTVTPDGKQISATFGPGATPGETCDVIVQNPDGCEDRPLPHKTVTVVSGPIVFYVDPPYVYNGVNTQITVYATTITGDPTITITPTGATMPVTTLVDAPVTDRPNRRQATVPAMQAAGEYDLRMQDASACPATLPKAIRVVSDTTVTMKNVVPPFGWTGEDTAVTVFRDTAAAAPKDKPFLNGARLFLNPSTAAAGDVAVPLLGVSFLDKDRIAGTVPKGTAVKKYDLILVNPDGTVGFLKNAYEELATAPPTIATATPSSIVNATGQTVAISGKNFGTGNTVTLRCVKADGTTAVNLTATVAGLSCTGTSCSENLTVDGSTLDAGSVCVIRVTNADGAYGEFSAIGVTGPSLNLSTPKAGTVMNVGRRALSAAAGDATNAQRFVYAVGGDTGMPAGALDSYEFAPVDLFGKMGTWTTAPVKLAAKRTLAGTVTVGRYIYNVGGDDSTGPTETAERAMILSPLETPEITDVDLALGAAGLDEGFYQYRVSATFAATDTDNPGGESLASDTFSIRVPAFTGKKVAVTLVWRKPVDPLGATLPNITGYKVYRIAKDGMAGSETLLATVTGPDTLLYKDDGTATLGMDKPLPLGSTGNWLKLPNMTAKRSAPGVISAFDPVTSGTFYVYAVMGKNTATTALGSYEFLKVTIAPNGRQAADANWTPGTGTNAAPRWQLGLFRVTREISTLASGNETWIFAGSGLSGAGATVGVVDATRVQAGGQLAAWDATPTDINPDYAGYAAFAAAEQLFVFGGQGGAPSAPAKTSTLGTNIPPKARDPLPTTGNWNAGVTMTQARHLMGYTVQSAFIFILGGQTLEPSLASKTTETVIW